jgi:hypothetical protein
MYVISIIGDTFLFLYNSTKSFSLSLYLYTAHRTLEVSTHVTESSILLVPRKAGSVTTRSFKLILWKKTNMGVSRI